MQSQLVIDCLERWTPRLLLGVCIILIAMLSLWRGFDSDEFEAIHSSWKIVSGQRIYIDFFQHHHPLLYYLLAPILQTFGDTTTTLLAARASALVFAVGIFWATSQLCTQVFSREIALTALVLLGFNTLFLSKVIEIRPDVPQTFFGIISAWTLFRFFERRNISPLCISALSLGIAFLFLQKAAFLAVPIGIVLMLRATTGNIGWSRVILYGALAAVPWFFYLATLFVATGADGLAMYYLQNFSMNVVGIGTDSYHPRMLTMLFHNLRDYSAVTALFAILSLLYPMSRPQKELTALAFVLLAIAVTHHIQWRQYYLQSLPLISIVAAFAMHQVFQRRKLAIVVCLVFAGIIPLAHQIRALQASSQNTQFARINFVLAATEPNDFVYDGSRRFNLYRHDLHFFWFGAAPRSLIDKYRKFRPMDYDIYALIDELQPRIISDHHVPDLTDPRIADYYKQVADFPDLYRRVNE